MKCTTNRQELLSLLGKLESVAKGRHSLPVLGSILLKAEKGKITAFVNDLEVILTGTVKAKISTAGAVCAPLSLISLLKATKSNDVTLTVKGKANIDVQIGNVTSTLEGIDAGEFPECQVPLKGKGLVVENILYGLGQVAYAMARESTRPVLNGVCFFPKKGAVELVAANGFMLATTTIKAKGKIPAHAIIPHNAVLAIQRLVKGTTTIRVHQNEHSMRVSFQSDGITVCTMAITGSYPDYKQLIFKGGKTLRVDRDDLALAIKICSHNPLDKNHTIRLRSKKGALIVSTKNNDTKTEIPAQGYAKYAYDGNQLMTVIRLLDKVVELRQKSPSNAGMFKSNGTTHLLMPKCVEW